MKAVKSPCDHRNCHHARGKRKAVMGRHAERHRWGERVKRPLGKQGQRACCIAQWKRVHDLSRCAPNDRPGDDRRLNRACCGEVANRDKSYDLPQGAYARRTSRTDRA